MSNQIIKRMEKLLYTSKSEEKSEDIEDIWDEKPIRERSNGVITCTKQRRLRQMQSELITQGSLIEELNAQTDVDKHLQSITAGHPQSVPIKELIDARIAQTEEPEESSNRPTPKDDRNRTLINLDALTASIYFWSPNAFWRKENKKQRFVQDKFGSPSHAVSKNPNNSGIHRNKETFINFSQPALVMVAGNPETPPSTLKWLAAHHSAEVRKVVAQNENADDETMSLLAEDFDTSVQSAVLDNARINKDLVIKLAASKNFSLASKARNVYYQLEMKSKQPVSVNNQSVNTEEMAKDELEFLKAIADSADTSRRVIVKSPRLASDWHVRMLVAGDPNATAEILWQLANHPVSQVRRKLVDKYNFLLESVVNLKGHKKSAGVNNGLAASATETIN
jgi:hypothetical protein